MSETVPAGDPGAASAVRTARERMLAGEPRIWEPDPELGELFRKGRRLVKAYNDAPGEDEPALDRILGELLGSVGEGVHIRQPLAVDYGAHISIGARTFVNSGLTALDVARITIGADVQIGPNVQLLTPTHPVDPEERLEGWETGLPITIGDNVWLGGGVIVVPGVTIGEHTVVGAGAVVTKDLPARVLAVGNPARVIRRL
ncbi:MAG: sugar O-acetyltransferase [Jiangellales bacterium]